MENLKKTLEEHKLWLENPSNGKRANLTEANLHGADLRWANLHGTDLSWANLHGADLREADLSGADLRWANLTEADLRWANLHRADLRWANLHRADLHGANLHEADLHGANLHGADLSESDLLCQGDMLFIRTMQFDTWQIGYTHDTLQIGCQTHPIEKWRKWSTPAGRKWVAHMDTQAEAWANKYLDLVLQIIDTSPAKE